MNQDESQLELEFWNLMRQNELLEILLARSQDAHIPSWYMGGGFIAQTIWNAKHGFGLNDHIKDIDWVYFDSSDLSEASECRVIEKIQNLFKDFPIPIDVKNQARVHLWYENRFGYKIAPYQSSESAIQTWPTTAASIAISRMQGKDQLYAPFGLSDLMNLRVRPNKRQITQEIYDAKVERWKKHWPLLQISSWD